MPLKNELKKAPLGAVRILIWPLYRLLSWVLAALGVRFYCVSYPSNIGHLAIEPDCYLKDIELGRVTPARTVTILLIRMAPANPCLLDYWHPFFPVVSNRLLAGLLQPLSKHPAAWNDGGRYAVYRGGEVAAECYPTCAAWGHRPPILKLTESHAARGEEALRKLGVPTGAWFVCVHSREPGYTPKSDPSFLHRNSSIDSYRLAMQEIVARGGWCMRMGEPSSPPLQPTQGVIDYRHSPLRSDWMDVFLCARCRFFLGSSSGLFLVSSVFGVPAALAHMAPMAAAYSVGPNDLSIPKLIADVNGKVLPLAQAFESGAARYFKTATFDRSGLQAVENSAEEIQGLVIEMIERLEARAKYSAEDEHLQGAFRSLFRSNDYSYGSAARIGRDFLRRHADLLMDEHTPALVASVR